MLCSLQTGKFGSNWLDRLRSNKGFPATDNNHDLGDFLNNISDSQFTNASNSHSADQPILDRNHPTGLSTQNGDKEWFNVMTNVLSDLFNMDGSNQSCRLSAKKSSRKQTNPKFCAISTPTEGSPPDCLRKDENVHGSTASLNSDNNNAKADYGDDDVDEEEKVKSGSGGDRELKGYSKSEVTVIDTSCEAWKFDKLLFRKRNIWKVRDKKGKSRTVGTKKKRKACHLESGDGNADNGKKKKANVSDSDFGSSQGSSGGNRALPSDDGQKPQDEKKEEVCKETHNDLSQVPKRRLQFSRSPRKSKNRSSSAILTKAKPTSKKSGKNAPNKSLKDIQK